MDAYRDSKPKDYIDIWAGCHSLLDQDLFESKAAYQKRCQEQTAYDWEFLYVRENGRAALTEFYERAFRGRREQCDKMRRVAERRWKDIAAEMMQRIDWNDVKC